MKTEKLVIVSVLSAPFATSYMVDREDKRTNNRTMPPTLKNNSAAGYQGPVGKEFLKDAGLLHLRQYNRGYPPVLHPLSLVHARVGQSRP